MTAMRTSTSRIRSISPTCATGRSYATALPFRAMTDFLRAGEIEGLAIDPQTDELLVLANRGSRIVLGMVKGFYPGYDKELHEVYVFEKVK